MIVGQRFADHRMSAAPPGRVGPRPPVVVFKQANIQVKWRHGYLSSGLARTDARLRSGGATEWAAADTATRLPGLRVQAGPAGRRAPANSGH
jgi:hypothetical protein